MMIFALRGGFRLLLLLLCGALRKRFRFLGRRLLQVLHDDGNTPIRRVGGIVLVPEPLVRIPANLCHMFRRKP